MPSAEFSCLHVHPIHSCLKTYGSRPDYFVLSLFNNSFQVKSQFSIRKFLRGSFSKRLTFSNAYVLFVTCLFITLIGYFYSNVFVAILEEKLFFQNGDFVPSPLAWRLFVIVKSTKASDNIVSEYWRNCQCQPSLKK